MKRQDVPEHLQDRGSLTLGSIKSISSISGRPVRYEDFKKALLAMLAEIEQTTLPDALAPGQTASDVYVSLPYDMMLDCQVTFYSPKTPEDAEREQFLNEEMRNLIRDLL